MTTRIWKDPSGRIWEVSLRPSVTPMGIPLDLPLDKLPATPPPANPQIRFTDPEDPNTHPSVPYTSGKPVSQLSDKEITDYWDRVVAAHPQFR